MRTVKNEIEIRFFPDWGRKEPLWSHDTWDIAVRTSDLPISMELAHDLHSYMDFWGDHFDPFDDWDSESSRAHFAAEGSRLIHELKEQLSGYAVIVDERDEDFQL
ncbi:hypothetical protein BAURA63_02204 [Brevibacterium aurantiacum]|uniref:Uncharacterized protein n=1 Tax=Brevibacterium aurantiacum TaxID=273384 RepID=A0A2H1I927_BREAU|nr:hypothetical protein [Brevibacterium aurantiacum]GEB24088.1 hypothetical protein BAU01nite_28210 [Brevibacterium aurantiacum]SMX71697.1 hypothetical protein BAUR920_00798 [Brevibacterium aurantiacum]SMX80202.1 hypothetical protein BAUR9175_01818 [Brevibacterium aurantiacum]SMX86107.1 hypothetical protein BAURA63_02204 [Brevibacterium aurantiacum]